MFLPGVRELVRPQWVAILEELKCSGGMAVPAIAEAIGMSYMGTKQHCEKLEGCGYVERRRVPRTRVGRPEILYRLTEKADVLFPGAGLEVLLEVLEAAGSLFGDTAPEKLVHRCLLAQRDEWLPRVERGSTLEERAKKLVDLRAKSGCLNRYCDDGESGCRIEEFHHPLQSVFERWPGLQVVEVRMIEELLRTRVVRREVPAEAGEPARIDYQLVSVGQRGEVRSQARSLARMASSSIS